MLGNKKPARCSQHLAGTVSATDDILTLHKTESEVSSQVTVHSTELGVYEQNSSVSQDFCQLCFIELVDKDVEVFSQGVSNTVN